MLFCNLLLLPVMVSRCPTSILLDGKLIKYSPKWHLSDFYLYSFFFFFSELIRDHKEPGKVLQAVACHSWLQLCTKNFVSCLRSQRYPEIALVGLFTAWKSTNTANPTSSISLNWVRSIHRHTVIHHCIPVAFFLWHWLIKENRSVAL